MKSIPVILLIAFSFISARAQEYDEFPEYEPYSPKMAGYLSLRNDLNLEDYVLGTEIGLVNAARNLASFITFDARPYRKKILDYQGRNQFYQFTEERYFIGAGVQYYKGFKELPVGAFVQVNGMYTWGKYGGTIRKPDQGWIVVPRLGLGLKLGDFGHLKVGYSYLDAKSYGLDKHRLHVAITGFLTGN